MAKKRRNRDTCGASPVSIGGSPEPASYAYVQSMVRQQTVNDCETLIREINERVSTLNNKLNSLRYS